MSIRPPITSSRNPFSLREWPIAMKIMGAVIGMIILVSVALVAIVDQNYRQTLLEKYLDSLEQTSHARALQVVNGLSHDSGILQHFIASSALDSILKSHSPGEEEAVFDPLRREMPEVEAAALVSNNGEVIAFVSSSPAVSAPNPAKWPWFSTLGAMPVDAVLIGGGSDAGLTGISGVHFSLPVIDTSSGKAAGVLYVVVDPHRYGAGLRESDVDIFLSDGTPLASWLDLDDGAKKQIVNSKSGSVVSNANPLPVAYGYVHIDDLGVDYLPAGRLNWTVTVRQSYPVVLADIQTEIDRLTYLIAAGAFILCLNVAGICYGFYLPVRKLSIAAGQIATTDNLDLEIPKDSSSDLVALSDGLQSLVDRLKHRATQLQTAAVISRESITQDVGILLTRIASILHKQMGFHAVYIYRMEPEGLRAFVEAAEGSQSLVSHRPGNSVILNDKSLLGQALHNSELQWSRGLRAAFPGANNQPAEVVIPFHGDVPRALHIVGEPEAFGQFDVNIFRLIASEIGATLENHHLLEEIEVARHEAESANRVKSQFLASVSHELRTPLNSIINFTRFVQRGVMGPTNDEQNEALGKVIDSGRHLLNIINDVLDISKIEANALELFIEPDINLHDIMVKTMPIAESLLGDKQVEIRMEVESDLPAIAADAQRVLQIVLNLLSNACKFTEAGSIIISAHRHNDEVVLAIQDTGPGIAREEFEAVFETFRQTETGLRQGGGTGLGMPISRRLAEAHGGRLWLESELGKGTTFFVALPIESPLLTSISN